MTACGFEPAHGLDGILGGIGEGDINDVHLGVQLHEL